MAKKFLEECDQISEAVGEPIGNAEIGNVWNTERWSLKRGWQHVAKRDHDGDAQRIQG